MKKNCLVYECQGDELIINIDRFCGIEKILIGIDEAKTVVIEKDLSVKVRDFYTTEKPEGGTETCKKSLASSFFDWLVNPIYEVPLPENLAHEIGISEENLKKLKMSLRPKLVTPIFLQAVKQDSFDKDVLVSKNSVLDGNAKPGIKNYSPSGNDNLGERYGK